MKKSACKHVLRGTDAAAIEEEKQHRRFPFGKSTRVCPEMRVFYCCVLTDAPTARAGTFARKAAASYYTRLISAAKVHCFFVNCKIF